MAEITSEEFERWMTLIREDIKGVHERLDGLNGRTRANEQALAVLQDRATRGAVVATAAASAIAAALEGLHWWVNSK